MLTVLRHGDKFVPGVHEFWFCGGEIVGSVGETETYQ